MDGQHENSISTTNKVCRGGLSGFQAIEQTRLVTDRRTDRCPGNNNMSRDPEGGDIAKNKNMALNL